MVWHDVIARFMDLIFCNPPSSYSLVCGLYFLAIYDIIFNWGKGESFSNIMMIIYYA
jgi:hypothetical protein